MKASPQTGSTSSAPNFDPLARPYRWMEWLSFGPLLWWCRTAFLPRMTPFRRGLTFGDGDGRFTARLLASNSHIRIQAFDVSPAMLARLRRNAGVHSDRLITTVADARAWTPPESQSFDLIYTHFFLDCLTTAEVDRLAQQLAAALEPAGVWVVSDFAIPQRGPGRLLASPLVALLYRAFTVLTGLSIRRLPDHRAALRRAGFTLAHERKLLLGILVSEWWVPEPEPA